MRRRPIGWLLAGIAMFAFPARPFAEIVEEIVAKVNDQVITMSEVQERESRLVQEMFEKFAGPELDQQMEDGRQNLLKNMIAEQLLIERGEAMIPDMDKVRDDLIAEFIKKQGIKDRDELERLLSQQGLTIEKFTEQLVRVTIPQEVLQYELRDRIQIDEKDMLAYYKEHEDDYRTPETVTFREFVLLTGEGEKDSVRERIEQIRQEVLGGADFETVILEESEAPSRSTGGLVGPFQRDELLPQIAEVAFSLKEGELSDILTLSHGFHLIRLEEHKPAGLTPFDAVREDIRIELENGRSDEETDKYIVSLWKDSYVYIYPRYRDRLAPRFLDISDLGGSDEATPEATP